MRLSRIGCEQLGHWSLRSSTTTLYCTRGVSEPTVQIAARSVLFPCPAFSRLLCALRAARHSPLNHEGTAAAQFAGRQTAGAVRHDPTRSGPWTLCMTNSRPVESCVCSPLSTHSAGSRRRPRCASTSAAPTSCKYLSGVGRQVGFPAAIRVDQGSEFVSRDLDLWAYQRNVTLDFSRPGKPTDNAFIESFNGKFRGECLNAHWFMSLDDAQQKCEAWRRDYNEVRPHSAIGNKPPSDMMNRSAVHGPPLIEKAGNFVVVCFFVGV